MADNVLIFQPFGKRAKSTQGKTVLGVARELGVDISSICGGEGLCGKCRIAVRSGGEHLSSPSNEERLVLSGEDLKSGFRLACQATVKDLGNVIIEVPRESQVGQQRLLLKGLEEKVKLAPAVRKTAILLQKPSLTDTESDADRLVNALKKETGLKARIDYEALRKMPHVLREGDWAVALTVWRDEEVISVEPGQAHRLLGLAVDVGTTKLAAYLLDLSSGKIVATASMMNPQISHGEDVISRIKYIMEDERNLANLQQAVVQGVNELIKEACKQAEASPEAICDMTIAGNTAMHHIFLGIPPNYVALMPYPAALQSPVDVKARELGLNINRGAYVHALPTIAGFVGGDAVADALATEIHKSSELSMLIDIGTNTEIVLGNRARLIACSCASGPAFEGAHIKCGMRAATGAIEHVWIDPQTLNAGYKTIDEAQPRGICGSAIIDVTAEMLKAGLIDSRGRFNMGLRTQRLRMNREAAEFVIEREEKTAIGSDIVVTQRDIREVQLAKAAIFTGASILMKQMGVQPPDICKIFLAGAFGNYVDPQSARTIGMYPDVPLERVRFVGNTAGTGARMALLSVESRKAAEKIASSVGYVELGADPSFQDEFLKATHLPHRDRERFPNIVRMLSREPRNT